MNVSLRAGGYEVINAQDAIAAVSMARQAKPDLIVLDIGLPVGDGFLVMERLDGLKSASAISAIPIIVVSAREAEPSRQRALKAGAQAFFQKPVDREEFMTAVRKAIDEPSFLDFDPDFREANFSPLTVSARRRVNQRAM
jgi:two-component system KDP operon response regulator KdpE